MEIIFTFAEDKTNSSMFKYCILLACFLAVIPFLSAQKAKDKKVEIKYVSLPTQKLPDSYTTYSVTVSGGNIAIAGTSTSELAKNVYMNSFKRVGDAVDGEFGHLRISVNTGTVSTGRLAWKNRSETTKDDKGVSHTTKYYWYELPCSGIVSFRIIDPDGKILDDYSHTYNSNAKSDETTDSKSLSDRSDAIYNTLRKNYASDMAWGVSNLAKNTLRTKYDFAFEENGVQFYTIKKHPDEDAFEASLDKTIEVFKALPANAPAAEGLAKLESPIKLWTKHAEASPGKDKDLAEVYNACNSNLANAYFYLDRFDDAKKHARRVLAVDEKDKRMQHLLENMDKVQAQMTVLNIHTMHYSRDLSNALPPTKVKEIKEANDQLQATNNSLPGYLVINTDTIRGLFMRSKSDEDFVFGPNGNTKFVIEKAGGMEEKDVTAAEVKAFTIGDRNFKRMQFSPCAKGKSEPASHILEQLYDSEKIKLYKYYPVSGTLSNAQNEFAFMKKDAPAPVSLLDTQFLLWDKGMANYFSDCTDLKDMCSAGGFKMNEDDLLKAARVYAEVCP